MAVVLWVKLVEPLYNKFSVALALGKDNGLPNTVAPSNPDAAFHQILQHNIDGRFVKYEFVQLRRWDKVRHMAVLRKVFLIALFVFLRQLVIMDTLIQKPSGDLIIVIGHQHMILAYRRLIVVGVGGNAMLHLEKIIGVAVYVCFGRSSQAHHKRVKIRKDGPVFLKNAPVALVNDNQIKVCRSEKPLPILGFCLIDCMQDSGVSGKDDARVSVALVCAEVA